MSSLPAGCSMHGNQQLWRPYHRNRRRRRHRANVNDWINSTAAKPNAKHVASHIWFGGQLFGGQLLTLICIS